MKPSYLSVNGVPCFIVTVGTGGRIRHFVGDEYTPLDMASPTTATLRSVWVRDAAHAWAVGDKGTVLHYDGHGWHRVLLAERHDDFLTVWGCEGEVWIGGVHRLIAHRTGGIGGALVGTAHVVRSIWGTGPDDMFLLADEGLVFKWAPDGCKIISPKDMLREEYNAIGGGAEGDDVYAVGNSGVMSRWDGHQWHEVDPGTFDDLKAVCVDGPDVWTVTHRGELRRSEDSGRTWGTVACNVFGPLHGLCIVDGTVWCCGEGGVVLQHRPEENKGE